MDMNNGDQYGLPDLRHLMAARTHFPVTSQPSDTFLFQRSMAASPQPQYEHIMVGTEFLPSGYVAYHDSSAVNNVTTTTTTTTAAATSASAIDMDQGIWAANDGGNSRWPRQETLTLLEIRSRLDSKFKEANQKGPLWDEVSRIMAEEHGYQRSGKKCREKFENLYKYYKKTKEGKAGRHDGKHYRFFRQLEAICGEASNKSIQTSAGGSATQPSLSAAHCQYPRSNVLKQETQDDIKLCESTLSFSTSSEFETSSSENNEDELSAIAFMVRQENKKMSTEECGHKKGKKSWKEKVKEFVDSQMRKIIENQDAWMEKTMKAIEDKEQERIHKEEEWRKQEEAKLNREHEFWARDRARFEARDAALMDALKKFTGKGLQLLSSVVKTPENNSEEICINKWTEPEFSTLLKLKTSMDMRYHESEYIKEGIWEEISAKMASLGYDRSAYQCRHKWENMNIHFLHMATEPNKKRKEELRTSNYFQHSNVFSDEASKLNNDEGITFQLNDNGVASSSQVHQNNSFQIMMNGEGHWWQGNCDLSLNN